MKKRYVLVLGAMSFLLPCMLHATTQHSIESANFLASKGVINDHSSNTLNYNLNDFITRREMLKVMMNLSPVNLTETCRGKFRDMSARDWGCKYAEAALEEGYIAANADFRPDDNVTYIEALKMIMQAKGIQRDENADWRAGYMSKAVSEDLIEDVFLEYDVKATRAWIFSTSARSYEDFSYISPEIQLEPEIEELFESLLGL